MNDNEFELTALAVLNHTVELVTLCCGGSGFRPVNIVLNDSVTVGGSVLVDCVLLCLDRGFMLHI